jgi:hypothetical protein
LPQTHSSFQPRINEIAPEPWPKKFCVEPFDPEREEQREMADVVPAAIFYGSTYVD